MMLAVLPRQKAPGPCSLYTRTDSLRCPCMGQRSVLTWPEPEGAVCAQLEPQQSLKWWQTRHPKRQGDSIPFHRRRHVRPRFFQRRGPRCGLGSAARPWRRLRGQWKQLLMRQPCPGTCCRLACCRRSCAGCSAEAMLRAVGKPRAQAGGGHKCRRSVKTPTRSLGAARGSLPSAFGFFSLMLLIRNCPLV
eukprot:18903_5